MPQRPVTSRGTGRRPSFATTAARRAACSGVTSATLEAHREVGQLPRVSGGAWTRPAAPRRASGPASKPQAAVLGDEALRPEPHPEVGEGDVAAHGEGVVEALERAGGQRAPQRLAAVALDAGARHPPDRGVRVDPGAVGRRRGEQLRDRGRLAPLREGRVALRDDRARVAHRGEHGAGARLDEDDRAPRPPSASRAARLRARSSERRTAVAGGEGREPSRDAGQERCESPPPRFRRRRAATVAAARRADRAGASPRPPRAPRARGGAASPRPRDSSGTVLSRGERARGGLVAAFEGDRRGVEGARGRSPRVAPGRRARPPRRAVPPPGRRGGAPRVPGRGARRAGRPRLPAGRRRPSPPPRPRVPRARVPGHRRARAKAAARRDGVAGQQPLAPAGEVGRRRAARATDEDGEAAARARGPTPEPEDRRAALNGPGVSGLRPRAGEAGHPDAPGTPGWRGRGCAPRPRGPPS